MKMPRPGSVSIVVAAVALAAAMAAGWTPGSPNRLLAASAAQPPPASAESVRRLLNRYCVACHNERRVTAVGGAASVLDSQLRETGLALDVADAARPERRRGAVGAGDREARGRLDAAGGTPAARRGGDARGRELARGAHRPGGRREPESGQNRFDASPEPHRVRQRDSRPPRSGDRRGGAAARRRDVGYRVRQQRGGPLHIDRATGALSFRCTEDLAPGHRCRDGARFRALRELRAADPGGPAERGPAARIPRRPLRHAPFSGRRQLHSSASR